MNSSERLWKVEGNLSQHQLKPNMNALQAIGDLTQNISCQLTNKLCCSTHCWSFCEGILDSPSGWLDSRFLFFLVIPFSPIHRTYPYCNIPGVIHFSYFHLSLETVECPFHHQSYRIAGESYAFHVLHSVAFIVNCFKNEQNPMQLCPTVKIHGSMKGKYTNQIPHVSVNSTVSPRVCDSIPGYYDFSWCKLYHLNPSTRDIATANTDDPCE